MTATLPPVSLPLRIVTRKSRGGNHPHVLIAGRSGMVAAVSE
jgi:hypothetical protein